MNRQFRITGGVYDIQQIIIYRTLPSQGLEDGHVLPAHEASCQRHSIHRGPEGHHGGEGEATATAAKVAPEGPGVRGGCHGLFSSEQGGLHHVQRMRALFFSERLPVPEPPSNLFMFQFSCSN